MSEMGRHPFLCHLNLLHIMGRVGYLNSRQFQGTTHQELWAIHRVGVVDEALDNARNGGSFHRWKKRPILRLKKVPKIWEPGGYSSSTSGFFLCDFMAQWCSLDEAKQNDTKCLFVTSYLVRPSQLNC